jgi:hypothetical protein
MTARTFTIRTRSRHPYALIALDRGEPTGRYGLRPVTGARIVGYAASRSARVLKRAEGLGAAVMPITDGRVEVSVTFDPADYR